MTRRRETRLGIALLAIALQTTACVRTASTPLEPPSGLLLISQTDARVKSPDRYFSREYRRINERRRHFGMPYADADQRPPRLVGLAMSGGGIRSNAYHLGILAGLYETRFRGAKLLDRVDYVSSVSGGSWANAGMWAWRGKLELLFHCLDDAAKSGAATVTSECADAVKLLRAEQKLSYFSYPGHQRKRAWKADVERYHLPNRSCNVAFDEKLPSGCEHNRKTRPYPIFNSTHSARRELGSARNFPFETTPDAVATVADDESGSPSKAEHGKGRAGFSLDFESSAARWKWHRFFSRRTPGGSDGEEDGTKLSLVAAHSSAVIKGRILPAAFLTYYFSIESDPAPTKLGLRPKYRLTDGGKSDNTGAFPLVDRGVDVLVVSHMGETSENHFGDLDLLEEQARKLLGCTLGELDRGPAFPLAQTSDYSCAAAPDPTGKPVLHVRPTVDNVTEFTEALEAGPVSTYLMGTDAKLDRDHRFPNTPTFKTSYDQRLIGAYYLLGKHVSETKISPFVIERLAESR